MEITFIFFGVIIILASFMLMREVSHLREHFQRENDQLRLENKKMDERVKKLESTNPKRLPFRTQDDVLDVIALLDMVEHKRQMEEEIEKAQKEHEDRLLKDAKIRLQKTLALGTNREKP